MNAPVLFTIANDLAKMQIDANVAEADVGAVEDGQRSNSPSTHFPNGPFKEVIQVRNAPTTVQNVVTYDTVIAVKNDELKLKPGMTANVSIIVAQRDNALKIPNAALRFRPPDRPFHAAPAGGRPGGKPGEHHARRAEDLRPARRQPEPVRSSSASTTESPRRPSKASKTTFSW